MSDDPKEPQQDEKPAGEDYQGTTGTTGSNDDPVPVPPPPA